MRFLKKKLALVKEQEYSPEESSYCSPSKIVHKTIHKVQYQETEILAKRNRVPGSPISKYSDRCLKNAAKNFGRAICNFVLSELSEDYLVPLVTEYGVEKKKFKNFIKDKKDNLDGIESFRELLLVHDRDTKATSSYKKIFQKLGEIFIKYFSVNWIFAGKLTYKIEYLKFRYKMLRRIQNPELFTYIR